LPGMLKRVVVDAGAIKYLINGADVMAPGLLHSTSEYPPVEVGEVVAVYGPGKKAALAVGIVEMGNAEVHERRTGVAIRVVSHLGDKVYSAQEK
ncbi:malignant T-cell-amplified sequence, partial [Nematocida major]|uniref:malignant T-cell-amplified sequence n=1 Tax=Nematocida major TaxID=1912982 RepID=UPI0020084EC7